MRPYRTLLAALVVACATLATPATASQGTWIEGTTTGWVEFTVKTEQTVRNAAITATGRYGGFYVMRSDRALSAFGQLVLDGAAERVALADNLPSDDRLEPGVRYRLYLIADGRTLVNFPGLRLATTKTLRPKHRARATFSDAFLGGSNGTWQRTVPIDLHRTVAVSLLFARSTTWALFDGTTCIVPAEDAADCDGGGYGFPASGQAYDQYRSWPDQELHPWPRPGKYVAVQRVSHPLADAWAVRGVTFTLTLV